MSVSPKEKLAAAVDKVAVAFLYARINVDFAIKKALVKKGTGVAYGGVKVPGKRPTLIIGDD